MSGLSLSLSAQQRGKPSRTPRVILAPVVSPRDAIVGVTVVAEAGQYAPGANGTLTITREWLVGNAPVSSASDFTPEATQTGQRLRYRETVEESGPLGGTTILTAFDAFIQSATVWDVSVSGTVAIIRNSPGPNAAPTGSVSALSLVLTG